MTQSDFEKHQKAAAIREFRLQAGRDPDAVRWQEALERMLIRAGDRLVDGRLESFDTLEGDEAKVFKTIAKRTIVPDGVSVIYIPPSALETMVADGSAQHAGALPAEGAAEVGRDIGVLIGARSGDFDTILYAQFGLPPNTPGAEIYKDGEILAVYQYPSIDRCISELNGLIETFLVPPPGS